MVTKLGTCPNCDGVGQSPTDPEQQCPDCKGLGQVEIFVEITKE